MLRNQEAKEVELRPPKDQHSVGSFHSETTQEAHAIVDHVGEEFRLSFSECVSAAESGR